MEAQRIARRLSIIKARNGESLTEAASKRTERKTAWRDVAMAGSSKRCDSCPQGADIPWPGG